MPPAVAEFHREYLVRLPLPLAQLYSRAFNAKEARARHDNAFYLFESLIKLAATPVIAAYLTEVQRGGPRVAALDRLLAQLALPSLGQWVAMLRELSRHFGTRADAASHPLGHLWSQLEPKHRDRPAILALYRRIKNGADGEAAGDQSCSLLDLLDALVQYRNGVFGHGASRFDTFYEQEMGPLLLPAASELLAEGVWDFLGPRGSRLVYLTELRTVAEGQIQISLMELVGRESERMAPQELSSEEAASLTPNCVAVLWPGRLVPLRLDPLLAFRGTELAEEVLFLNRDRNGRQAEYLSYTTGRTERDRSMGPALAKLLSQIAGREISEDELQRISQQSLAETPSLEALFGPGPPTINQVGDFELLAEIGRGGMGVVYLARQLSLGRLVALKMLPADLAADEVALARFRREMRALGRCEHPHIVKVLSNGTLPDGRLYYTMEYVPGADLEMTWRELAGPNRQGTASSLGGTTWSRAVLTASRKQREAAARHTAGGSSASGDNAPAKKDDQTPTASTSPPTSIPELHLPPLPELPSAEDDPGGYSRRVAQLIRDAALALQAVHEQGIVHRDVKPANLMLTPDGQRVVLMDFGLAKGQSLSLSASKAGGLLGTLRYAAPEQLAAASLRVGPTADVRGLGVTLWELLTRERLFGEAGDERQLAAMVHDQDVPRLRSIDPTLDADLEAIVSRATERRVSDRIQTAGQLAEYLQLYLDGTPLPIRPPSAAELLRRWLREHKGLVGSAAVAAAAIVLTVTIAFISVTGAKNAAVAARNEAVAAQKQSDDRNELLLEALRGVVNDIQQKLHNVPRSAELRKSLLTAAIPLLERVAGSLETAARADHALLASHLELGDVFLSAGAGATDSARRQYETALELALKLNNSDPNGSQSRGDLALTYAKLVDLKRRLGKLSEAREDSDHALAIRQKLADDEPRDAQAQRNLAVSLAQHTDLDLQQGDLPAALTASQQAQAIFQRLATTTPDDRGAQRDLAQSYRNLGDAEDTLGNYQRSAADFAQSLNISQQLANADAGNVQYQRDLASSQERLADEKLQLGDSAAARNGYRVALQITKQLVQQDPQNSDAQRDLAIMHRCLGDIDLQLRDPASARAEYQQEVNICQTLAQQDPANVTAQQDLRFAYRKLGDACALSGDLAAASSSYEQTLKLSQRLAQADAKNAGLQHDLAAAFSRVGNIRSLLGEEAAAQDYQQAVNILQQSVAATPQDALLQRELAAACGNLGDMNRQLDDLAAARQNYQQELNVRQQLAQAEPANVSAQTALAWCFIRFGMTEEAADEFAAAGKWFQQSLDILARLDAAGKLANQPLFSSRLKYAQAQLALCQAAPQAVADPDFALKQPGYLVPELLALRGRALARAGRLADAAATAEKLLNLGPKDGGNFYFAAGIDAICSADVATAKPQPTVADAPALQKRYATRAMELLKQAQSAQYFTDPYLRLELQHQHNLDPLRGRDDFKKLLAEVMAPAPVPPSSPAP